MSKFLIYKSYLFALPECPRSTLNPFSTRTNSLRVDRTDPNKNVSTDVSGAAYVTLVWWLGLTQCVHARLHTRQNTTWHHVWTAEKMLYDNLSLSFVIYPVPSVLFHGTVILSLLSPLSLSSSRYIYVYISIYIYIYKGSHYLHIVISF